MQHYRPDIDGLRAVAILPVLLFHAGITFFAGGYVGVDVFFVISGYLITRIIHTEITEGRFSILTFYERRARRILPALVVMCLCASVAAYWLFIPSDFKAFAKSLMSTMLFYSNIQFLDETGYFARASELKPLLHSWSLAVEEQFYIIFPLLVAGVWAVSRKALPWAVFIFFLASLIGSIILSDMRQVYAFFLSPTRAWELALGALIAMNFFPAIQNKTLLNGLSVIGLGLIIYAIISFDETTHFPSYTALIPVLGAGLLIYTGGLHQTSVAKLLSFKPFIWVGLISYSLYLWHWPLIVFAKYHTGGHLPADLLWGVIVLSFLLAWLSWKFVEQPFRQKSNLFANNKIFVPTIFASCLAVFAIGYAGKVSGGFPARWGDDFLSIAEKATQNINEDYACRSFGEKEIKAGRAPCSFGAGNKAQDFFVWGDSHAISLYPAFESLSQKHGLTAGMASYGGCPPLLSVRRLDKRKEHLCLEFNQLVKAHLVAQKPKTVFLIARWPLYADGHNPAGPQANKITFIGSETHTAYSRKNSRLAFAEGLSQTLSFLRENGITPVVVAQVPEHHLRIGNALIRASARGQDLAQIGSSLAEHQKRQQNVEAIFASVLKNEKGSLLDPAPYLCKNQHCAMTNPEGPLYTDYHHLSRIGALALMPLFEGALEKIKK